MLPPPEDQAVPDPPPGSLAAWRREVPGLDARTDGWLLQADAARQAGCSVSAIRKWRREGSVSSRKITTPAGLERVEVRVDDVIRRAGRGPVPGAPGNGPGAATLLVPIGEFQALVARVSGAEQRAAALETRLRSLDMEASQIRLQLAQLSRRIEEGSGPAVPAVPAREVPQRPAIRPPAQPREAAPSRRRRLAGGATPDPGSPEVPRRSPPVDPALGGTVSPPAPRRPAPVRLPDEPEVRRAPPATFQQWLGDRAPVERGPRPRSAPDAGRHVERLRALYERLQKWQGRHVASAAEAESWLADLAAYDAALVRVCRILDVEAPFRVGERLPAEARVALTRALAARGADVRTAAPGLTSPSFSQVQSSRSSPGTGANGSGGLAGDDDQARDASSGRVPRQTPAPGGQGSASAAATSGP